MTNKKSQIKSRHKTYFRLWSYIIIIPTTNKIQSKKSRLLQPYTVTLDKIKRAVSLIALN